MKNQYIGDIGDYAKFSLLRALGEGRRGGIAWYHTPDDATSHGSHRAYLDRPEWANADPEVLEVMRVVDPPGNRSISYLERTGLIEGFASSRRPLAPFPDRTAERAGWRSDWFAATMDDLAACDFVFADPDCGLCLDERFSAASRANLKHIPLSEAKALAQDRMAMIYHHHGMIRKDIVIANWREALGPDTIAINFSAFGNRTFFIVNPDDRARDAVLAWAACWPRMAVHA